MKRLQDSRRLFFFICACLITVFLVSRLVNLTKLPIFTDEAIYIRWSQIGSQDANWRFISLTDGKQPLFTWILMAFLKIIKGDPLFVGRLVSVTAGFVSLVGIWFLSFELFRKKSIACIAAFLYIISPFTLMYDRLALYDSWVTALSLWNLYIAVRFVKNPRLDTAMFFALTLAAGELNKTSGFLSLYLMPFTLLLFDWKSPAVINRLWKFFVYTGIAAVLSTVYYSVLRLSPYFHMIALKNTVFVYPLSEWITHPFRFFLGNMNGLLDWTMNYHTIPVFVSALVSLIIFRNIKQKILLFVWWIVPLVGLALFARTLYPRFVLFMSVPLLILAATTIDAIIIRYRTMLIGRVLVAIICIQAIIMSYLIVLNPVNALIPLSDRLQLLDDWPAGGGIVEVNTFLADAATRGKLAVYTDGTFGLLPYAVEIYQVDNPNIEIHGIWPVPAKVPEYILTESIGKPVYLILNQRQEPLDWPMQRIASYEKGKRHDRSLRLYRIISPESTVSGSLQQL